MTNTQEPLNVVPMDPMEASLKTRIRVLAKIERGGSSRRDFYGPDPHPGLSFNTYENFESGKNWPQEGTLRKIEELLGWATGSISEALASGLEPALITTEHMHGEKPFRSSPVELRNFADSELMLEMERRMAERKRIAEYNQSIMDAIAARGGMEGIKFDELPDE